MKYVFDQWFGDNGFNWFCDTIGFIVSFKGEIST